MCPLSDDALLDWALARGSGDPSIAAHLAACTPCRERSRAVRREQELLRGLYAQPLPPVHLSREWVPAEPRNPGRRLATAAMILFSIAVGFLVLKSAGQPSRPVASRFQHEPLSPIQSDLGAVAQRIAVARGSLPESEDPRASAAYLELLAQEEGLYIEGMAHYLSERSPLTEDQELQLRRIIQDFYARSGERADPDAASRDFRGRVRSLLDEPQYLAFEEFSRQGMEWQWKTDIAMLMDDLCGRLDLRFSEAERLRRALETNYPHAASPVLRADRCPTDPLVENSALSGAVRSSLDSTYQRKFDSYLGYVKAARDRAQKIIRRHRSPE
jgi:hypothetical protein